MAGFDAKQRELTLRLVLCGPTQAGKSATLDRLRERLGDRGVASSRTLASQPAVIYGEPTARLLIEVREVDPTDAETDLATCAIAAADGVIFVADSRRERLRDVLVAYAWFLERLREAGRNEMPGVLLLNRRDSPTCLTPIDLEAALGSGRFPSFETDATRGEEIARGVGEVLRRAATRVHGELMLGQAGITLPNLLGAVDVSVTRESAPPKAAAPAPAAPAIAKAPPAAAHPPRRRADFAPIRSPLLRFGRRMLADQAKLWRARRRLRDQLAWIEEEARRPIAFLKTLFLHLEREAPRLSTALDEAVAGGAELLGHLEAILNGTRRHTAAEAARERTESHSRPCNVPVLARQAFASVERAATSRLKLQRGALPWVDGDPDVLRALFWAAFTAVTRSNPVRKNRSTLLRLRVESDGRALRLRMGHFGTLKRGAGIEELVLARRLARRLGLTFKLVRRKAGRRDLCLELGHATPARARTPELQSPVA
jgi:hypothetical protein